MYVMVGGRQSGKTYAMTQWLLEDPHNRVICVIDAARARHLARQVEIISKGALQYRDALEKMIFTGVNLEERKARGRSETTMYAIDNAEEFLRRYIWTHTGRTLEFVTFNGTPVGAPGEAHRRARPEPEAKDA